MHVPSGAGRDFWLGTKANAKVLLCYKNCLTSLRGLPVQALSLIFLPFQIPTARRTFSDIISTLTSEITRTALSTIAPLQTNIKCATTRTPHFPAAARLERILWYADMSMMTWPSVWPILEQTRSQSPKYVKGNAARVLPSANRKYFLWARDRPEVGRGD